MSGLWSNAETHAETHLSNNAASESMGSLRFINGCVSCKMVRPLKHVARLWETMLKSVKRGNVSQATWWTMALFATSYLQFLGVEKSVSSCWLRIIHGALVVKSKMHFLSPVTKFIAINNKLRRAQITFHCVETKSASTNIGTAGEWDSFFHRRPFSQSTQGRQNAASLVPGLQASRDLQGRLPGAAGCCRVCYSGSTSPCGELKAAWRAMIWIEKITLILQMFAPILFEAAGCIPCFPDSVVYYLG